MSERIDQLVATVARAITPQPIDLHDVTRLANGSLLLGDPALPYWGSVWPDDTVCVWNDQDDEPAAIAVVVGAHRHYAARAYSVDHATCGRPHRPGTACPPAGRLRWEPPSLRTVPGGGS
jgi:hypothetical protein